MKLINKLTLRYFKSGFKRNLLTAFTVIMAVAMFTATGILVFTAQNMMNEYQTSKQGDWHYRISIEQPADTKISYDLAESVKSNVLVESSGVVAEDMYIKVGLVDAYNENPASDNDYTFYNLKELNQDALKMFPYEIRMIDGRMPQNENEICISNGSISFWQGEMPIGKAITYDIGTGIEYGDAADNIFDFQFNQIGTKELIIVGVYERVAYGKVPNVSEAFTVAPAGDHHSYSIYFKVLPTLNYKDSAEQILNDLGLNGIAAIESNNSYLRWIGQGDDIMRYAFIVIFAVLFLIIIVSMTMVIKNAFALSYSQKVSLFGLLRCIGMNQKQVMQIILFESLAICFIAQPLGIGLAIIAVNMVLQVISGIDLDVIENVDRVIPALPILIAVLASYITVIVASYKPARFASNVSPVEAIKGESIVLDVDNTKRNNGKRKAKRIFALDMAKKNMKRNKQRYRTTLLSLAVSIALFIPIVGMSMGLNYSLDNYSNASSADFFLSSNHHAPKDKSAYIALENELKTYEDVESIEQVFAFPILINVPVDRIPANYENTFDNYFNVDKPYVREDRYGMLGANLKGIDLIPVSRENYDLLKFNGSAPNYDDLVNYNQVLICQTETFRKNGSMSIINFADFSSGETVKIGTTFDEQLIDIRDVYIAGEVTETPWYAEGRNKGYLVVPVENLPLYLSMYSNVDEMIYNNGMIAIKAKNGMEEALSQKLSLAVNSSFDTFNGYALLSPYKDTKELKDMIRIINIFIYGFAAIILMMCCLNIFNTIAANLSNRTREMAMLRSIGMSNKQLKRSLNSESVIYGFRGTILGGLVGVPTLYGMTYVLNRFLVVDYQNPIYYIVSALVFSIVIAVAAGMQPIRRALKANLVESLRDAD